MSQKDVRIHFVDEVGSKAEALLIQPLGQGDVVVGTKSVTSGQLSEGEVAHVLQGFQIPLEEDIHL